MINEADRHFDLVGSPFDASLIGGKPHRYLGQAERSEYAKEKSETKDVTVKPAVKMIMRCCHFKMVSLKSRFERCH
jgi:hypothetical protein